MGMLRRPWRDQRAERALGALACGVLLLIFLMILFVFAKAWPSFTHNGIHWFGSGGNVDRQLQDVFNSPADKSHLRLPPQSVAAAVWNGGHDSGSDVARSRAVALLSDVHRRVRATQNRRVPPAGSSVCWPPCRRSCTG